MNLRTKLSLWTLEAENFENASELHGKQLRFWTHKLWNCAQNFFCERCRQITSKMRLNFTGNSFVFEWINCEIAPKTFSANLWRRISSKMRLNFTENSFVFGRINLENASRTFFINLIGRKLPNGIWSEQQTALHFWMQKSIICAQNFSQSLHGETSKMRLNFTANLFVFGRINWENAPRTFL